MEKPLYKSNEEINEDGFQRIILRQSFWIVLGKIFMIKILFFLFFLLINNFLIFENTFENSVLSFIFKKGGVYFMFQSLDTFIISWVLLSWFAHKYTITSKSIIIENGILISEEMVFSFANIESVRLKRSFLGSVLQYGTIDMQTPILQQSLTLKNIPKAKKYMEMLEKNIGKDKTRTMINQ